ncbi:hypothetical protein H1P_130060 [Hyella patelloides LEGE 07179]|uniref:Uncharacterized protein n=1 Tax=Hyella patelloides LEGE 07179 TaxID=945734 RepID=A0A563VKR1_9CYAN|nr:hypothetical protein [Hyella patelloides]VEP12040.1 hypothetical protein H1P_130060 [Hyella patelloides LEGE 07179]
MDRHYVLKINPQANHEWDRCVLRNPITGEHPDLKNAIAKAVQNQPGSYLIKVSINVEILEQTIPHNPPTTIKPVQKTSAKLLTITN